MHRSTQVATSTALLLAFALASSPLCHAQKADQVAGPGTTKTFGELQVETLAEGLNHPWSLAFLPDQRILITERAGNVRVWSDGNLDARPIDGVPSAYVAGQGGMLDLIIDPDFASSPWVYLSFAHGSARANATRVVRAKLVGHALQDLEVLFTAQPSKSGALHYGGRMAFLPDGTLTIGLGDGFGLREQAQDLDSHLGKIVRIARDGSVPSDNPFVNQDGALPEIYSYGHRNVQGLIYDADLQQLIAHEHGPRGGDELNLIRPGLNYGWPKATHGIDYSGAMISPHKELDGVEPAIWIWTPSIAPAGLAHYPGATVPAWQGSYFISALAGQALHRLSDDGDGGWREEVLLKDLGARLRDVRVGPDGALYLLTDSKSGRLLRVRPKS